MRAPPEQLDGLIEWSVASRPIAGQTVSGDVHVVQPYAGGILVAVIDGLGHGDEATAAAMAAVAVLEEHAGEFVIPLLKRCHQALLRTRGAAITLASINSHDHTLTWLGVGNVEGRLLRRPGTERAPRESVLLRSGLVGFHLPPLYASVEPLGPGDLLLLATDGIRVNFDSDNYGSCAPAQVAARVLERHFKGSDDGLVLAVRYQPKNHPHAP